MKKAKNTSLFNTHCPFCGEKLEISAFMCWALCCPNTKCITHGCLADITLWRILINTKEQLDIALDAIQLADNGCNSVIYTNHQKLKEIKECKKQWKKSK